jgi:GT2 family glycosyltransferase
LSSQPHVAIAILNYNGKKYLETYLPTVLAATYANKSVWVIDNQSSDDSLTFTTMHFPEVQIIQNGDNCGFAEGYNKGLKKIEADYYLLLNSDVKVLPNFIEPIVHLMQNDAAIAFVQPKIRWLHQPEKLEYAGAAGGMLDALGYPFCRGRVLDRLEFDAGQYNDTVPVFWATGACMFARADTYWKLGGMYSFFYMHNEEIDLCWRAQNAGYKVYACGESTVYHVGGGSLEKLNPRKTFYNFRNNMVMLTRNMPVSRLLWLVPIRTALDIIAGLQLLATGHFKMSKAVLRGMAAYWYWLFFHKDKKWPDKRGFSNCKGVFHGSIVWNYFFRKQKTYREMQRSKMYL